MKRHSNLISTRGVLHSHAPDVATLADVTQEPSDFLLLSVGYERISSIRLVSNNNKKTFWVCWRSVLNEIYSASPFLIRLEKEGNNFCACLTALKKARNFEPSDRLRHRLDWLMVSENCRPNALEWQNSQLCPETFSRCCQNARKLTESLMSHLEIEFVARFSWWTRLQSSSGDRLGYQCETNLQFAIISSSFFKAIAWLCALIRLKRTLSEKRIN